jgi:hypothetical protein
MVHMRMGDTLPRMEISSISSSAQATETQQALMLKKAINTEQSQVLALIESVMPDPAANSDSSKVGQLFNATA